MECTESAGAAAGMWRNKTTRHKRNLPCLLHVVCTVGTVVGSIHLHEASQTEKDKGQSKGQGHEEETNQSWTQAFHHHSSGSNIVTPQEAAQQKVMAPDHSPICWLPSQPTPHERDVMPAQHVVVNCCGATLMQSVQLELFVAAFTRWPSVLALQWSMLQNEPPCC